MDVLMLFSVTDDVQQHERERFPTKNNIRMDPVKTLLGCSWHYLLVSFSCEEKQIFKGRFSDFSILAQRTNWEKLNVLTVRPRDSVWIFALCTLESNLTIANSMLQLPKAPLNFIITHCRLQTDTGTRAPAFGKQNTGHYGKSWAGSQVESEISALR